MEYSRLHQINNLRLVRQLVEEKNLDVNKLDEYGLTPLHYCENLEIVKYLVSKGAKPVRSSINNYLPQDLIYNKETVDYLKSLA